MEELDKYPNDRVASQIEEARVVAQLAYDKDMANTIVQEAAGDIQDGRYVAAVQRYLDGFGLQEEAYKRRDYGNIFRNNVAQAVGSIRDAASAYVDAAGGFEQQVASFSATVQEASPAAVATGFTTFQDEVDTFLTLSQSLLQAGELVRTQLEQVPQLYPDDPVDWHLTFLEEFTLGSERTVANDGIAGAIYTMLRNAQDAVDGLFTDRIEALLVQAEADLDARNWSNARDGLNTAAALSSTGVANASLLAGRQLSVNADPAEVQDALRQAERPVFYRQAVDGRAGETLSGLASVMQQADSVDGSSTSSTAEMTNARDVLNQAHAAIASLAESWDEVKTSYQAVPQEDILPDTRQVLESVLARLRGNQDEVAQRERVIVSRLASRGVEQIEAAYQEALSSYDQAQSFLDGEEVTVNEGTDAETTVTYHYPDRALSRFQETAAQVQPLVEQITGLVQRYNSEPEYVTSDPTVAADIQAARDVQGKIQTLSTNVTEGVTTSQSQVAQAQQLQQEADRLVQQARQAISTVSAERVQRARDLWEQARNRYFESLEIQQDAALRQRSDQVISNLGNEIQDAQNRLVVQQVRQRITQASQLLEAERYAQARDTLTEASQLWHQTNVTDNAEIQQLLNRVNVALSIQGSRTLQETEPLYPVLSNYLNIAQEDFNKAESFRKAGQSAQASDYYARADRNLENVLAVRPQNWEARVLKLRILQATDSANFDRLFQNRYNEAVGRIDSDPTEALTALQTLKVMKPDYSGIDNAIARTEIKLGIRPNPVTQARIAESNNLVQEAQQLASRGGEANISAAIARAEQALQVYPGNNEAQLLKDQLAVRRGGDATVTLSSEDEQLFRRAQSLYIAGDVGQALTIVQQLWDKAQNRQYPQLVDLRNRILRALGQQVG